MNERERGPVSDLLQNSMLRNKPALPPAHEAGGIVASSLFDNRPK